MGPGIIAWIDGYNCCRGEFKKIRVCFSFIKKYPEPINVIYPEKGLYVLVITTTFNTGND